MAQPYPLYPDKVKISGPRSTTFIKRSPDQGYYVHDHQKLEQDL